MKRFYLLLIIFMFATCKEGNENIYRDSDSFYTDNEYDSDEFTDGYYCAEVEYYNPNTGTRSTYDLDVVVEDGYLVRIDWPNGGWLDETNFSREDITSGECSFTSDRGYQYTVILGDKGGGCYNDGYRLRNKVNEDTENTTCPKCGDEKDEYDYYCYSCKRKIEDELEQEEEELRNREEQQQMYDGDDEY